MITPFAMIYAVFTAFQAESSRYDKLTFTCGTLIGICLAAFYWVPAVFEQPYIKEFGSVLTTGTFHFSYRFVPLFKYIQFPWRFLGIATFFFSAFAGLYLERHAKIASFITLTGIILCCLWYSANQRAVFKTLPLERILPEEQIVSERKIGRLCSMDEYLPKWFPRQLFIKLQTLTPVAIPATTRLNNVELLGKSARLDSNGNQPSRLILPYLYYPGWQAKIDGHIKEVQPDTSGFLALDLPPGSHHIELVFTTTRLRVLSWSLSITAALLLFFLFRTLSNEGTGQLLPTQKQP